MHAFSTGECTCCGRPVTTVYTPCNKVCPICSANLKLCEICGAPLNNDVYQTHLKSVAGIVVPVPKQKQDDGDQNL